MGIHLKFFDGTGNGIFTIQELRNQVKELTEIVTLKEGAVSGMKAGRDAAIARATSREVEIARLKIRLAEVRINKCLNLY